MLKEKEKKASLPLCGELNSPRLLFKATFQTNQHHSIVTVSWPARLCGNCFGWIPTMPLSKAQRATSEHQYRSINPAYHSAGLDFYLNFKESADACRMSTHCPINTLLPALPSGAPQITHYHLPDVVLCGLQGKEQFHFRNNSTANIQTQLQTN